MDGAAARINKGALMEATGARRGSARNSMNRPWWFWVLLVIVALLILYGIAWFWITPVPLDTVIGPTPTAAP